MSPPRDPIILEEIIKKIKKLWEIKDEIKRGIIFWKVKRIKKEKKCIPSEIWGNHTWNGAAPSLIIMVIKITNSII